MPRDDLSPGLRTAAFERRCVIVCRVVGEVVDITDIFHGGRDHAALYRRGEAEGDD